MTPHPRAFCISLEGSPRWPEREAHFKDRGITAERFRGFDGAASGLVATISYEVDKPNCGYKISAKGVGMAISHVMLWTALVHMPEDAWMILEDDAEFEPDWRGRFDTAVNALPPSWDMCFLGSCNCFDKSKKPVKDNLFQVFYPSCTHAYMVRRKALSWLLNTNKRIYAPIDCSLVLNTFHLMDVYTVLPRLASQKDTFIRP